MNTAAPTQFPNLEQAQVRVLELSAIPSRHRDFAAAQREIETITSQAGWQEPVKIEVKKRAGVRCEISGIEFSAAGTAMVYPWQYRTLVRCLEMVKPSPKDAEAPATEAASFEPVNCGKLKVLLEKIAVAQDDILDLDRMEEKANGRLAAVAANREIKLDAARKEISEANISLDFVRARRKTEMEPINKSLKELHGELSTAIENWNRIVGDLDKKSQEQVIAANLPFFHGNRTDCRRMMDAGVMIQMPLFALFRDAYYEDSNLPRCRGERLIDFTNHFLRHIATHATKLTLPEGAIAD